MKLFFPSLLPGRATRRVWPWWLLALSYYVTCCLMHLRFSIWLVRQRDTVLGQHAYAELVPWLAMLAGVALLLWLIYRLRHSPRWWLNATYWLLWLVSVVLIDHYLTFSINEYAHYPQYALLAWLLARAMDPQRKRWYVGRVLFWSTLLGMGDELLQYLWITTSYSEYLDFNDFLSNLVAAAGGMLLYYGTANTPPSLAPRRKPVLELTVTGAIVLALLLGFQSGRLAYSSAEKVPPGGIGQNLDGGHTLYLQRGPDFYGSWPSGPRHGRYHVLAPVPGVLLLALVGWLFGSYRTLMALTSARSVIEQRHDEKRSAEAKLANIIEADQRQSLPC